MLHYYKEVCWNVRSTKFILRSHIISPCSCLGSHVFRHAKSLHERLCEYQCIYERFKMSLRIFTKLTHSLYAITWSQKPTEHCRIGLQRRFAKKKVRYTSRMKTRVEHVCIMYATVIPTVIILRYHARWITGRMNHVIINQIVAPSTICLLIVDY